MALLGDIRLPELSGDSFGTEQQIRQILEYMMQLNRKLDFVLQNLDEENMTGEMAGTVEEMRVAAREIEHKVSNEEFSSYIRQTAEKIEMRVHKNEVISSINMSPEEITIQAKRISLEGIVTVNGYFKINLDGTMEATGGKIAGWTIDEGALYTGENTASVAPTLYLGTRNIVRATAVAASAERRDWRIKVGSYFGVTSDGTVYAQNGDFRGTVSAGRIQYGLDASGNDRGTFSGGGITLNTIYGSRMVAHTLGEGEMETAYANMKVQIGTLQADVAYIRNLFAGYGSISVLNVSQLYYKNRGASWFERTLGGTTIIYMGNS